MKCRLHKSRVHAVPGEGPLNAKIMLIGEAPGYWEDREGKPFVGSAGKLLDEMFAVAGIERDKVYITNVVKCRPPGNRTPKPDEIQTCISNYLEKQIGMINPRLICALGNTATSYLLAKHSFQIESMGKIHGKIYKTDEATIIPIYHPAAALHRPPTKNIIKEDWKKIGAIVKS